MANARAMDLVRRSASETPATVLAPARATPVTLTLP